MSDKKLMNIIQIAGIIDQAEAEMLVECGVDYLGFPLRLPVHREDITDADAAMIIQGLRPPQHGVLITYLNDAKQIHQLTTFLGTSIVQLHGDISIAEIAKLKQLSPGLQIIKSLIIRENNLAELVQQLLSFAPHVTAFITDTYDPTTGASGATGKTHDWQISRKLAEASPVPLILAGGLNPQNVREAILTVKPAGVDSHTGVEDRTGRKNKELVSAFVAEARAAFDLL